MIYLLILLLLIIFAYRYDIRGVQSGKKEWYFFFLFILILLVGLRYRIGTDSITYESWFYSSSLPTLGKLNADAFSQKYEPLFVLFSSVVKTLFNSWVVFQLFHATIINSIAFRFFKKYSTAPFICITIYYVWLLFPLNCEIMRQSLATSVCLLALPYLLEKKYVKYYLIIFIAIFFHRSTVLFLILPFVSIITKRSVLLLFIALGLMVATSLSEFLNDNYLAILLLFENSGGLYESLSQNFQGGGFSDSGFSIIGMTVFFMDGVLLYVICKFKEEQRILNLGESCNLSYKYIDNGLTFFIIIQTLSLTFPIFYRFAWLFYAFAIIYLSSFIKNSKIKTAKGLILFSVVVSLFLFRVYSDNFLSKEMDSEIRYYRRYVPYTSIIGEEKIPERERIYDLYDK